MKITRAIIERVRNVNTGYMHLELASVDPVLQKIKPGQSLLVRLVDADPAVESWDPYLPEQWWPIGVTGSKNLVVERPYDASIKPQQDVLILGPVGQPYRFRKSLRNVLLVAYDTEPTPLTIMTTWLLANQVAITLVLLGSARQYDTAHLPEEVEVIRGDDAMEWDDMVMTLGWADQVFVVVGQDDELMRFGEVYRIIRERRNEIAKNYLFGVFQPPLPCGVGGCSACLLKMKQGQKFACTDGPAFDLSTVRLPG